MRHALTKMLSSEKPPSQAWLQHGANGQKVFVPDSRLKHLMRIHTGKQLRDEMLKDLDSEGDQ